MVSYFPFLGRTQGCLEDVVNGQWSRFSDIGFWEWDFLVTQRIIYVAKYSFFFTNSSCLKTAQYFVLVWSSFWRESEKFFKRHLHWITKKLRYLLLSRNLILVMIWKFEFTEAKKFGQMVIEHRMQPNFYCMS